jgi:hypothetical protein
LGSDQPGYLTGRMMEHFKNIVESDLSFGPRLPSAARDEGALVLSVLQAAFLVSLLYV